MRSLYPTPEDKQVAAHDAQIQIDQHYRTKEQQRCGPQGGNGGHALGPPCCSLMPSPQQGASRMVVLTSAWQERCRELPYLYAPCCGLGGISRIGQSLLLTAVPLPPNHSPFPMLACMFAGCSGSRRSCPGPQQAGPLPHWSPSFLVPLPPTELIPHALMHASMCVYVYAGCLSSRRSCPGPQQQAGPQPACPPPCKTLARGPRLPSPPTAARWRR